MASADDILQYLKVHPQTTADEIIGKLQISRSTAFRILEQLTNTEQIAKTGARPHPVYYSLTGTSPTTPADTTASTEPSGALPLSPLTKILKPLIVTGDQVDTVKNSDPPLLKVQVTNPVTYLKKWWAKTIAKEGVHVDLTVKPLTAIFLGSVLALGGFGVGRVNFTKEYPFVHFSLVATATPTPTPTTTPKPTPTPDPWREAGFTGTLKFTQATKKYFLLTTASEAITLELPAGNVDLTKYIGKRIFATGSYHQGNNILKLTQPNDVEILPTKPVNMPELRIKVTPSPEASESGKKK